MKGRTRRDEKEADMFAVQNLQMDRRISKDQCGNLYVGHEKVTARALPPPPFRDIFVSFTLSQTNDCAVFSDLFYYNNIPIKEIRF